MFAAYGTDPLMLEVGPVRLWWYGLAYAVGLLAVSAWVFRKRGRLGYDGREVAEFCLFFATGLLVGGRLFDVALYEWFYYAEHPGQIPCPWEGGMATHGVMLGAVAGTLVFCRLRGKSFFEVADEVVVPGAALMALGRVGNHVNGEVFGSLTGVAWAMEFPYAAGCRHPVALYDAAKNLVVLGILLLILRWYARRGGLPRGLLLGHFLLWYGGLRIFVDLFREYDSYWLGIGRGQFFNGLMALAGLAVVLVARWHAGRRPVRNGARPAVGAAGLTRAKWAAFYALVALCLTIPSGWTQQVLERFEERGSGASTVEPCRRGYS